MLIVREDSVPYFWCNQVTQHESLSGPRFPRPDANTGIEVPDFRDAQGTRVARAKHGEKKRVQAGQGRPQEATLHIGGHQIVLKTSR
jgi:hypothetical protein